MIFKNFWSLSGGAGISPSHIIFISSRGNIEGKQYTTWQEADAYITAKLSPSNINRYGIYFTEPNSESVIIRPNITLLGNRSISRLSGPVTTQTGWAGDLYNIAAEGIEFANLTIGNSGVGLFLNNCLITGGTAGSGTILIGTNSILSGGDWSNCLVCYFYQSSVISGGTFGSGLQVYSSFINSSTELNLAGGTFSNCAIEKGPGDFNFNAGIYNLSQVNFPTFAGNITIGSGVTFNLSYVSSNSPITITYNAGATINDYGTSKSITLADGGGTYNNLKSEIKRYFTAENSGVMSINTGGTPTILKLDTESLGESAYDNSTGYYTIPEDGKYEFWGKIQGVFTEQNNLQCIIGRNPSAPILLRSSGIEVFNQPARAQGLYVYSGVLDLTQNQEIFIGCIWSGSTSDQLVAGGCLFSGRKIA